MILFNIGLTYGFTALGNQAGTLLPAAYLKVRRARARVHVYARARICVCVQCRQTAVPGCARAHALGACAAPACRLVAEAAAQGCACAAPGSKADPACAAGQRGIHAWAYRQPNHTSAVHHHHHHHHHHASPVHARPQVDGLPKSPYYDYVGGVVLVMVVCWVLGESTSA